MRRTRPRPVRILRVRSRRVLARLDRAAPVLLFWIPSWGTSLLLHAAALLLLALYLYARSGGSHEAVIQTSLPGALTEDVDSLEPSDHSGDPFTTLKSADSPSLSLESAPVKLETINQPEVPALERFGPELAGPDPIDPALSSPASAPGRGPGARRGTGKGLMLTPQLAEEMIAPFSGRQGVAKAQMLRREGGTARSEKAVEDGLDWLARHQRSDGGWSLNFQGQCQAPGCPDRPSIDSDTAATGLSLLPLLGAGHTHMVKNRYQGIIRKGLDWLVEHQQPSGELFIGGDPLSRMYSHAIGTMALCEACGLSGDPALRLPAQRAVEFIIASQNVQDGGWRYLPQQPGDTSVFGWQMFALRSARLAGLQIPKNVFKGCKFFLDVAAVDDRKATYSYKPGGAVSPVMTAEALLGRQYLGWPRDFPPLVKGAAHVAANLEQSQERNIYYWYYATQLLHNMQGKDWRRWNVRVREALIAMQVHGNGCDRGSWDPALPQADRWGAVAGRLFLTSLSLLTLEVYYRYLPLYKPSDSDTPRPDDEDARDAKKTASRPERPALKAIPPRE